MQNIRNISGDDRTVPYLGDAFVMAGQIVQVDDDVLESFICQATNWQHVDDAGEPIAAAAVDLSKGDE